MLFACFKGLITCVWVLTIYLLLIVGLAVCIKYVNKFFFKASIKYFTKMIYFTNSFYQCIIYMVLHAPKKFRCVIIN